MNSNKTIFTLLLIIIILGAAFGLQQWQAMRGGKETQIFQEQVQAFSKENIEQITLTRGDQVLAIRKENEQWRSDQALIDALTITTLVDNITAPNEVLLISQNADQHPAYEVTTEKATTISFATASEEKKILVGTPASGNYYVRFDGSNDVWGVDAMTDKITDITLSEWLDKQLLAIDEQNIATLVVDKSGNQLTLQQRDNTWYLDGGEQPLDKASFSDLLMQLESMVAIGVIDDEQLADFPSKPAVKLTVNVQGASPATLELFTGKDAIMAKVADRPGNFEISQSAFDDLNLSRSDISFAPTPTPSQ
jgi:hypothetical protein